MYGSLNKRYMCLYSINFFRYVLLLHISSNLHCLGASIQFELYYFHYGICLYVNIPCVLSQNLYMLYFIPFPIFICSVSSIQRAVAVQVARYQWIKSERILKHKYKVPFHVWDFTVFQWCTIIPLTKVYGRTPNNEYNETTTTNVQKIGNTLRTL